MDDESVSLGKVDALTRLSNNFRLPSHLFIHVINFVTLIVYFLAVPVFMMTSRQTRFVTDNANSLEVIAMLALVFLLCYAVLNLTYWMFAAMKLRSLGAFLVLFIFSWVIICGFLSPLTTADGRFEPATGPTNLSNLTFSFVGACVVSFILFTKLSNVVLLFFGILVGGPLAVKLPNSFKELGNAVNYDQVYLSKNKNIIVVSLDGVPGHISENIFAETPGLAKQFKDFVYFPNTSASAPYTHESLTGVMLGNSSFPRTIFLDPDNLNRAYFNDKSKYNFYTYKNFGLFNRTGTEVGVRPESTGTRLKEIRRIYKLVTLRLFTKYGVRGFEFLENNVLSDAISKTPNSTRAIDEMPLRFELGSDRPAVIYMHFVFTHFPNTLDQNCSYRAADPEWIQSNQNEIGVRNTTICGLKKLVSFQDRLKDLGVYENSLIVFLSDHGKPAGYFDAPPHNFRINKDMHWGYNRYRPMLMIKSADAAQSELQFDQRIVVLDDLAKTTCGFVEAGDTCESLVGLDLLDPNDIAPNDFNILVVNEKKNEADRTTSMSTRVSREIPLEQAMRENDDIELSESVSSEIPLTGGVD